MYHRKCQENTNTFLRWQVQKANQARETQQPMASSNDDSQNQNQMLLQGQAQQMANKGQQQTGQQVSQLQAGNHLPLQMTGQNAPGLNPMAGSMFQRNFPVTQDFPLTQDTSSTLALNMQNYIQSQQQASAQQQQRTQQQLQAQQQNLPQQQQQQTPLQLQRAASVTYGTEFKDAKSQKSRSQPTQCIQYLRPTTATSRATSSLCRQSRCTTTSSLPKRSVKFESTDQYLHARTTGPAKPPTT